MAWVCKNCNSDNDDSLTACELCGCTEKLVIESHKSILMRKQALELDVVSGVVIVPSAYNIIGAHAFEGNNNIKTVVLHDEVISIYKQAFKDCVNLEKVVCEGMLDSIGPEAFRNCRALKIKPVAKSVDKSAFETDSLFMAEGSVPSRTSTMTPSITTTPIRSGVTSYEDTTRHTSYHFDLETLVKTLAVVIPIIAFIVGQALQYYWLFIKNKIYFLDMFFSAVPATVLYVSSAFCLVSTIHVIIRSWKLADDDELGLGALYFSFSSLFLGGIAPVAGYVGIIVTSAISWLCVTFNEEKVPALLLFLSCAVGLTFMWLSYNRDVNIFLFTKFMRLIDADPFRVMIYLSVATGVSIVASAVMAVGMAYFPNPTVGYGSLGVFCSLMAIVPAIAIPGLLIYAIVFAIISKNDDEHVAKVGAIAVVVVFLITVGGLGVFCGVGKQKTYTLSDYEIVSISSFQDFRQYLNEEVIAMNISKVSESDVATIITGENCKTLVLVSDHNKKFSLTIKTSAKKIILSDVNINYGGLVLDAEKVEIKLYGRNSIIGEEDYIKMVNMFKKDKTEMQRKIDAEGERQAKAATARKAEEDEKERELSEIIANARALQAEEQKKEESADEMPLAENTEVSAIMSQVDRFRKKLGQKEENVAEIPVWLNSIHTTVMVKADLSDTPIAVLQKIYLHYNKRGIVKKFGENSSLCSFNGNVAALDKKKSVFQLVFKNGLVTLNWDLPIKEQISAKHSRTIGEDGELAVFVFVAMQN